MATAATIFAKLGLDIKDFTGGLKTAKSEATGFKGHFAGISTAMQSAGKLAFAGLLGGAALAVTAVGGVTAAIGAMTVAAAPVESLQTAFYSLSEQAGTTGDDMLAAMQKGSGGMISARDLMTQFNMASSLVSDEFAKELPTAMELVSKAAAGTGQDMGFLMDSLVKGVGRVSPMILDNLGVQVDLTEATEAYAASNGLVASELTKTEQQMAVQEMVMGKLQEKYGSMESVYDTSAAKMAQFKATIQDTKDQIGMAFLPILSSFMSSLGEVANAVLPNLSSALENISPIIDKVALFIKNVTTALFDAGFGSIEFKEALTILIPEDVVTKIFEIIDGVTGFVEKIKEVLQPITDWIANNIELKDVLTTVGLLILTWLVPIIAGFISSVVAVGAPIVAAFAGVMAAVVLLRKAWETDFGGIQEKTRAVWEFVKTFVTTAITNIKAWWDENGEAILVKAQEIWTAVSTTISTVITTISTIITTFIANVKAWWDAHGAEIMAKATEIWNAIVAVVQWFVEQFNIIFGAFKSASEGDWEAFGEQLRDAWDRAWEAIIEILGKAWESIKEVVGDLVESVINFFKETDWLQVGKDVVQGIADGITKGAQWAIDAIKSLASSMWDALKGFFKSDSPSKLMMEMGYFIDKGLAKGIEKMAYLPIKEMTEMSNKLIPDDIVGKIQYDNAMMGEGRGDSTVNNYNLTMPTSSSPEDVIMAFDLLKAYGGV